MFFPGGVQAPTLGLYWYLKAPSTNTQFLKEIVLTPSDNVDGLSTDTSTSPMSNIDVLADGCQQRVLTQYYAYSGEECLTFSTFSNFDVQLHG
ncbi:hypothetical protein AX14_000383 [Amanita brunnescens Koide BX004]|nr:hypothetical protein AX14_000383 [Amanita brunnescens Koide BX004]